MIYYYAGSDYKKKGVTFIELLLYISISAIILMISSVFLSVLLSARVKNQTMAEVGQQGMQIMQIITNSVRNADLINFPLTGDSGTSLSLALASSSLNPTFFTFSSDGIQIQEGAGEVIALSSSRVVISDVIFQNLSLPNTPGIVRVQFTVSHINPSGRNEYSSSKNFTTSISLRSP